MSLRGHIFISRTESAKMWAKGVQLDILKKLPNVTFWEMGDIPPTSGSADVPKFSVQIKENIDKCDLLIGLCDKQVKNSHPVWGCPAEWTMALKAGKPVLVLAKKEDTDEFFQNAQVSDLAKSLQFQWYSDEYHDQIMNSAIDVIENALKPKDASASSSGYAGGPSDNTLTDNQINELIKFQQVFTEAKRQMDDISGTLFEQTVAKLSVCHRKFVEAQLVLRTSGLDVTFKEGAERIVEEALQIDGTWFEKTTTKLAAWQAAANDFAHELEETILSSGGTLPAS